MNHAFGLGKSFRESNRRRLTASHRGGGLWVAVRGSWGEVTFCCIWGWRPGLVSSGQALVTDQPSQKLDSALSLSQITSVAVDPSFYDSLRSLNDVSECPGTRWKGRSLSNHTKPPRSELSPQNFGHVGERRPGWGWENLLTKPSNCVQ